MSLNRYAAKPDSNKAEIVTALKDAGCMVYDLRKPVDLLVGKAGKTLLVEIKRPVGKQAKAASYTKAQKTFLGAWTGGPVATVTDAESAIRAVRVLEAACLTTAQQS
jgi:hypothetical protein